MTELNEALVAMNELPEDEQMKAAKIEREQEKENKLLNAEASLGKGKVVSSEKNFETQTQRKENVERQFEFQPFSRPTV